MFMDSESQKYDQLISVVFSKTNEPFGGLSNMAEGFPLKVNSIHIRTSEALYQACRFPHLSEVQQLIIEEASPVAAKTTSKLHRDNSRPDWDQVRVDIMRWCLRVKLVQNWERFSVLLLETGERPIVEKSHKDTFWGAKMVDDQTLIGTNMLGCLFMELREAIKRSDCDMILRVEPLTIPNFHLMGQPIQPVVAGEIREEKQN
jgi:type I restriction enzyme, S subunit